MLPCPNETFQLRREVQCKLERGMDIMQVEVRPEPEYESTLDSARRHTRAQKHVRWKVLKGGKASEICKSLLGCILRRKELRHSFVYGVWIHKTETPAIYILK